MGNIKEILSQRRQARLKDKFTVKSYVQKWRNTYLAALPTSYILQLGSAALAAGIPAYAIKVVFDSWLIGFAVGAVIMFLFEYFKRQNVNNASLSYFAEGRLSALGGFGVALFMAASIVSSCFSVPILISEFAPMPSKPVESDIVASFDSLSQLTVAHWGKIKQNATDKATEVHKQNNWKGVTTRDARKTKLSFEQAALSAQDSLNSALAAIGIRQQAAIDKANQDFETETAKRNREKQAVGAILGFVTLGLELLFVFLFGWCNYYDFSEAVESGLITFESSKSERKSPANTAKAPHEAPKGSSIGFQSEGKVVFEGGKYKILCRKSNGDLKAYDSAYLSTLIGQSEGTQRHAYWLEMKEKLKKAKA